jgi:hypothetical protein
MATAFLDLTTPNFFFWGVMRETLDVTEILNIQTSLMHPDNG